MMMRGNYSMSSSLDPADVKVVKKETFNRWYTLMPYYMALTISRLPLQVLLNLTFMSVTYWMSGLPEQLWRFGIFVAVGLMISLVAEGMGLAIGATFSITVSTSPNCCHTRLACGAKQTFRRILNSFFSSTEWKCCGPHDYSPSHGSCRLWIRLCASNYLGHESPHEVQLYSCGRGCLCAHCVWFPARRTRLRRDLLPFQ